MTFQTSGRNDLNIAADTKNLYTLFFQQILEPVFSCIAYKCMFFPGFQLTARDPGIRQGGLNGNYNPFYYQICMLVHPPRKDPG